MQKNPNSISLYQGGSSRSNNNFSNETIGENPKQLKSFTMEIDYDNRVKEYKFTKQENTQSFTCNDQTDPYNLWDKIKGEIKIDYNPLYYSVDLSFSDKCSATNLNYIIYHSEFIDVKSTTLLEIKNPLQNLSSNNLIINHCGEFIRVKLKNQNDSQYHDLNKTQLKKIIIEPKFNQYVDNIEQANFNSLTNIKEIYWFISRQSETNKTYSHLEITTPLENQPYTQIRIKSIVGLAEFPIELKCESGTIPSFSISQDHEILLKNFQFSQYEPSYVEVKIRITLELTN